MATGHQGQGKRRFFQQGRHWLQAVIFGAVLAMLVVVVYTSAIVQRAQRAELERSATATAQGTTIARETAAPQQTARAQSVARHSTAVAQALPVWQSTPVPHPSEAISTTNADRLQELARWGRGMITTVAWSPNGRLLAIGTTIGVYLYDVESREEVRYLETHMPARALAFSPDGQTLAVGWERAVQLWQVTDGTLLRTLQETVERVLGVAFSPEGDLLLAKELPPGDVVRLWRQGEGGILQTFRWKSRTDPPGSVRVAISPDGQTLACGWPDGMIELWQVTDGELAATLEGPSDPIWDPIWDLAFSQDGQVLVSRTAATAQTRFWGIPDVVLLRTVIGHSVALSPDGQTYATVTGEEIELRRLPDGAVVQRWPITVDSSARPLAFSPDGRILVTQSWDSLQLWQVADGALLDTVLGYGEESIWDAAFSLDGEILAAGATQGTAYLWEVAAGRPTQVLNWYDASQMELIWSLAMCSCPDGQILAAHTSDRSVSWSAVFPVGGEPESLSVYPYEETMIGYTGPPASSIALSPDCSLLAASFDSNVSVWHVVDGDSLYNVERPSSVSGVFALALSPDGALLALGLSGGDVQVWHIQDNELLYTAKMQGPVRSVAFSPDGQILAGGGSNVVHLWDAIEGTLVRRLRTDIAVGMSWPVVAFSPDGQLLVGGADDGTIVLWQVEEGTMLRRLEGHTQSVFSLTFSSNGGLLASTSSDGTIRIWGVR